MPIQRRYGAGPLLETDSDSPGLIQKQDGSSWVIWPGGVYTQLPGGGGGGNTPLPTAVGDMLYSADGATWTLLPVGAHADGEVLTLGLGVPDWDVTATPFTPGDALALTANVLDVLFDGVTIGLNGFNELESLGAPPIGPAGGDLTGSFPNPVLVAIGAATGPIGDATHAPVVTIDAKGRVTALTSVLITGTAPGGPAGGVLAGTYPNPDLNAAIAGSGLSFAANVLSVNTPVVLSDAVILDPATSTRNVIQPTADRIPLSVRGFAGQTNPLFVSEDSAGNDLVRISASGVLEFGTSGDTNLYRAGASSLKTDDALTVALSFSHLGTTLGVLGASPVVQQAASTFTGLWTAMKNYGLLTAGSAAPGEFTDAVIILPTTSARNVIQPSGAAVIPLTVKGFAAQSVDLQEWQDSSSAVLTSIGSGGKLLSTVTGEFTADGTGVDRGLRVSQHNSGINAALLYTQKSRGTRASPTAVASGDVIGVLGFAGYDGDEYIPAIANIAGMVTGAVSNNVIPTSVFITTGTATTTSLIPQALFYHTGYTGLGRSFGDVVGGLTAPLAIVHIQGPSTLDEVQLRVQTVDPNQSVNNTEWWNFAAKLAAISPTGQLLFGSTGDVNLYRPSANLLKTDDAFTVALAFSHLGTTFGALGATPVVQQAASTISALWTGLKNYGLLTTGSAVPTNPGLILDYVQNSGNATSTATVQASATTVLTSNSVTFDGTTPVLVQFWGIAGNSLAATFGLFELWEGTTDLVRIGQCFNTSLPTYGQYRYTPTAGAKTLTIRVYNTGISTTTLFSGSGIAQASLMISQASF